VVDSDGSCEYDGSQEDLESSLTEAVNDLDIAVVTGHFETTWSGKLLDTVCEKLQNSTTVVALPSIPQHGLSNSEKEAFIDLVKTSDTTAPFDLTKIEEINNRECTPPGNDPLAITNGLIVELITDVFAAFQDSLAAPPLPHDTAYEIFENGGLTLLFRGSWKDSADPTEVVERTVSNPMCTGDLQTATGGFGFVRFGDQFTLREFEKSEELTMESLASDRVDDDRWIFCGDSSQQENEGYRLGVLVADISIESLGFVC